MRLRLGAAGPTDPIPCQLCGKDVLTTNGAHALCCSKSEITRGHNRVAKAIYDAAKACDPNSQLEAPNLIPGTRLRPADVLTGALSNGLLALDIGIASPDAQHAGNDCVDTMYAQKSTTYVAHEATLQRQNITYQPLIWSAHGRPHPSTTSTLRTLATRLSRRRGYSGGEWRYRRCQHFH